MVYGEIHVSDNAARYYIPWARIAEDSLVIKNKYLV